MNEKARPRSQPVESKLKTFVHKTREAVATGDKTAVESILRVTTRRLDVATSRGIIHKNQAA